MKNFESFKSTLSHPLPSASLPVYLTALWYDANGDWNKAHSMIDSMEDTTACWVHAYLHRKEGDIWNADYWYKKAGRKRPDQTLEQEWEAIVKALL